MNKEWSEINKLSKEQLKKKETFQEGIETLLKLRKELMKQIDQFHKELSKEQFCAIPYINAKGYHCKTIAYSLYHVFRIEDIVLNSLIKQEDEVFFAQNFAVKMNSPIITTGNELIKQEIADFSEKLDIDSLYEYVHEVDKAATKYLKQLTFDETKRKMTEADKERLHELKVVSENGNAVWLIDYWCGKTIRGLLFMPFSSHWIMHVEACLRIMKKL